MCLCVTQTMSLCVVQKKDPKFWKWKAIDVLDELYVPDLLY